ncbi:glutamate--cysteine ligase [Candidatus Poribacteria bacterium]|nr:glutamate--cysteine ligase [Candidatus Poribacteria bacterium]
MAFGVADRTSKFDNALPINFVPSPKPTLGVEVELQLVDPVSFNLAPKYEQIAAALPPELQPFCKYELFQCIAEVITPICESVYHAAHELNWMFDSLHRIAGEQEVALMGCGTHPFADWREQPISNDARYNNLVGRMGWPARRLLIFGTHVHVGVDSGEKAVAVMNSLTCYVPHLMAISSSSPYWVGTDTNLASSRLKVFELLPTAGLPPRVTNWRELVTLLRTLIAARAVQTIREVWWDVRPHPSFGTIEIRICDGLASPGEILVLTAFIQMLVVHLGKLYDAGEYMPTLQQWTLKENKWRAARWADEAFVIRNEFGDQVPVRDHLEMVLKELTPTARELGTEEFIPEIYRLMKIGPSFRRQREFMAEHNCHRRLVRQLLEEFRNDTPLDGLMKRCAAKYEEGRKSRV